MDQQLDKLESLGDRIRKAVVYLYKRGFAGKQEGILPTLSEGDTGDSTDMKESEENTDN